jgi:hypothetical protein
LSISARFLFSNSFEALVLRMILQFAVETVFPISVGVAPGLGVVSVVAGVAFRAGLGCSTRGRGFHLVEVLILSSLESCDFIIVVLRLDGRDGLLNFRPCLPQCIGRDLVHVVQG